MKKFKITDLKMKEKSDTYLQGIIKQKPEETTDV